MGTLASTDTPTTTNRRTKWERESQSFSHLMSLSLMNSVCRLRASLRKKNEFSLWEHIYTVSTALVLCRKPVVRYNDTFSISVSEDLDSSLNLATPQYDATTHCGVWTVVCGTTRSLEAMYNHPISSTYNNGKRLTET